MLLETQPVEPYPCSLGICQTKMSSLTRASWDLNILLLSISSSCAGVLKLYVRPTSPNFPSAFHAYSYFILKDSRIEPTPEAIIYWLLDSSAMVKTVVSAASASFLNTPRSVKGRICDI